MAPVTQYPARPLDPSLDPSLDPPADGPSGDGLFSFERELYAALDFMPLDVRRKLDLAGIKISLDGWRSLPLGDRRALAAAADDAFGPALLASASRSGAAVAPLAAQGSPPWRSPAVPPALAARLAELEASLPDAAWAGLADGARYVLLRLASSPRDDGRLRAALGELGIACGAPPGPA
jgi:hypothetical protein